MRAGARSERQSGLYRVSDSTLTRLARPPCTHRPRRPVIRPQVQVSEAQYRELMAIRAHACSILSRTTWANLEWACGALESEVERLNALLHVPMP